MFDTHAAVMLTIDPADGRIVDANAAAARFYGYPLSQLRGMRIADINTLDEAAVAKEMARATAENRNFFRFRHRLASGELRDVEVWSGPSESLGKTLLTSVIHDVTAGTAAVRALQRIGRLHQLLSKASGLVAAATVRQPLLEEVCRLAVDLGGFRLVWVGLLQPDGAVLPAARAGHDAGFLDLIRVSVDQDSPFGRGPTGRAARTLQPVIVQNVPAEPSMAPWHKVAAKAGLVGYATFPLHQAGVLLGTLNFCTDEADFFGDDEVTTLAALASDVSVGLDWLHKADGLSASAASFRNLFEANPHPMWVADAESHHMLAVNDAALLRYGYSREEFLQLTVFGLHPAADLSELTAFLAQHSAVISRHSRWRHQRKDGTQIWVDVASNHILWENRRARFVLAMDVTAQVAAEQATQVQIHRLEQAMAGTVSAVSSIMDLRDPYTAGHERRVGEVASAIAVELGLEPDRVAGIKIAGALHDVGKVTVPAEILAKPGRLSPVEFELVKTHALHGFEVLRPIEFAWPVALVALQHHERVDGSGYPQGLRGEEILLEARIMAVADVVESMASHRPYRPALGIEAALREVESQAGKLYDADVVGACLRLFRERGYEIPA